MLTNQNGGEHPGYNAWERGGARSGRVRDNEVSVFVSLAVADAFY